MRNVQYSTFTDIHFPDFCSFMFKVPVKNVVIDKEELHGIEIDDILNLLENLSRTLFIDLEYWNVKVVVHVESSLEILL